MNELLKKVTPLTTGIIWLVKDERNASNPYYAEIDYLLNGLLTSYLKTCASSSTHLLMSENFGKPFYVFLMREKSTAEVASFVSLIKKDLRPENQVLVIDEWDGMKDLKTDFKEIQSSFHQVI